PLPRPPRSAGRRCASLWTPTVVNGEGGHGGRRSCTTCRRAWPKNRACGRASQFGSVAVRQRGSSAAWRFGSAAVRRRGGSGSLAVRHGRHREAARGHGWVACGGDCCMPCVFLLAPVPAAVEGIGAQAGVLGGFDPAAVADDVRHW